jgi:hypothetical protein
MVVRFVSHAVVMVKASFTEPDHMRFEEPPLLAAITCPVTGEGCHDYEECRAGCNYGQVMAKRKAERIERERQEHLKWRRHFWKVHEEGAEEALAECGIDPSGPEAWEVRHRGGRAELESLRPCCRSRVEAEELEYVLRRAAELERVG